MNTDSKVSVQHVDSLEVLNNIKTDSKMKYLLSLILNNYFKTLIVIYQYGYQRRLSFYYFVSYYFQKIYLIIYV